MPKIALAKTILIDAPASQVYSVVSDLDKWTKWSPWLLMEPKAKVVVSDDKQSYSWEGKRTGTGNMHITATDTNKSVDFDLTFLTPWKSFAKVGFELEEKGGKTEATWTMDSSLPWFMFWMKKMMVAFVGMDYERGLRLLKDVAEDGKTHSALEFKGASDSTGFQFIGIKSTKSFDEMGKSMSEDFPRIISFLSDNKIEPGLAFTQYHKWEVVKGLATYTSGVQVESIPDSLPEGMITGEIPSTKVHTIRHTGPYHHLGNAWSTLYTMQRGKEFKLNKAVDPFEVYMNNPMEVAPNELITEIHFPIK